MKINLEDCIRDDLLANYEEASANLFDDALTHVYALMRERLIDFQMHVDLKQLDNNLVLPATIPRKYL